MNSKILILHGTESLNFKLQTKNYDPNDIFSNFLSQQWILSNVAGMTDNLKENHIQFRFWKRNLEKQLLSAIYIFDMLIIWIECKN